MSLLCCAPGYYRENYHNKSRNGDGENSGRGGYTNRQQGARGGHNSQQQQGGRGSGGHSYRQQQTNSAKPAPFKYDSDFDFESANARFKKENLEQEFEKLRLDSGSSRKASVETLGEEEAGSDDEVVIVEEGEVVEEVEECYDKSKSFFDNISCEGTSKKCVCVCVCVRVCVHGCVRGCVAGRGVGPLTICYGCLQETFSQSGEGGQYGDVWSEWCE